MIKKCIHGRTERQQCKKCNDMMDNHPITEQEKRIVEPKSLIKKIAEMEGAVENTICSSS
jgi:hypothetical protein